MASIEHGLRGGPTVRVCGCERIDAVLFHRARHALSWEPGTTTWRVQAHAGHSSFTPASWHERLLRQDRTWKTDRGSRLHRWATSAYPPAITSS